MYILQSQTLHPDTSSFPATPTWATYRQKTNINLAPLEDTSSDVTAFAQDGPHPMSYAIAATQSPSIERPNGVTLYDDPNDPLLASRFHNLVSEYEDVCRDAGDDDIPEK